MKDANISSTEHGLWDLEEKIQKLKLNGALSNENGRTRWSKRGWIRAMLNLWKIRLAKWNRSCTERTQNYELGTQS
jgi:hypothetical protein